MIPTLSNELKWLKDNVITLKNICRGIERETLRINLDGQLSNIPHPFFLGSALTNKWITTDFSESSLEFITPVNNDINFLLNFLNHSYHFVSQNIINERMWPLSIPLLPKNENMIPIAQYGSSKIGEKKTIYRQGLKNRYGSSMHMISGIHYNFSLSLDFWKKWKKINNHKINYISEGYFKIIRNYHRFGWIIPYLFGSSPTLCSNLIKNKKNIHYLKKNKKVDFYAPWSTSLRLSNFGYKNYSHTKLNMKFNSLNEYLFNLKYAINTPFEKFEKIGLKNSIGLYNQLNTNILQMENELYTPVRPKILLKSGESYLKKLSKKGIEYIEIRSLDINPFYPIGINKEQILFLDLLLIWCLLIHSPFLTKTELKIVYENWNRVIFEGRKPNQHILINKNKDSVSLMTIGKTIFQDLFKIAEILDLNNNNNNYYNVCLELIKYFDNTELTYSAQLLDKLIKYGIKNTGLELANKYYEYYKLKPLNKNINDLFLKESKRSIKEQDIIEKINKSSFLK
ncbi:Glutamate--cysteine ligase [Buchnera aphidicola (Eriosoma grossulariae)]|uniref:glutamate--cysteine ligase n=1 Tax=Buchnera aphidicola TaxID=9 RepID=UPI003463C473